MSPEEQAEQLLTGWPEALRDQPHYLGYRRERRASGRWGKRPVRIPGGKARACGVDPRDERYHLTFAGALEQLTAGRVDGVGIVLAACRHEPSGLPLCAVDLDGVLTGGVLEPAAREIVDALASFTQVSSSGQGVHSIVAGHLPARGRRGGGIELVTHYLAATGLRLPGTSATVEERQRELLDLHARLALPAPLPAERTHVPPALSDERLLAKLRRARNADRFSALYDRGDLSGYDGDHSRADLALVRLLSFYTRDRQQLRRLWERSALSRPERMTRAAARDGRDYASVTIDAALRHH